MSLSPRRLLPLLLAVLGLLVVFAGRTVRASPDFQRRLRDVGIAVVPPLATPAPAGR